MYDTFVQQGSRGHERLVDAVVKALDGTPVTGIEEHRWIIGYLEKRRSDLEARHSGLGQAMTHRIDDLLALARAGNWDLSGTVSLWSGSLSLEAASP